jgi:hypothetical protein
MENSDSFSECFNKNRKPKRRIVLYHEETINQIIGFIFLVCVGIWILISFLAGLMIGLAVAQW